jgi:hypothetical protein
MPGTFNVADTVKGLTKSRALICGTVLGGNNVNPGGRAPSATVPPPRVTHGPFQQLTIITGGSGIPKRFRGDVFPVFAAKISTRLGEAALVANSKGPLSVSCSGTEVPPKPGNVAVRSSTCVLTPNAVSKSQIPVPVTVKSPVGVDVRVAGFCWLHCHGANNRSFRSGWLRGSGANN